MKELVLQIDKDVYLSLTPAKLFGQDDPSSEATGVSIHLTDIANDEEFELYLDDNQIRDLTSWLIDNFAERAD